MVHHTGKWLLNIELTLEQILAASGGLLLVLGRIPGIGPLPGDLLVERGKLRFYFPVTTCILIISPAVSLIPWWIRR